MLDSPGNRVEDNSVSGSSDAGIAVERSTGTLAAGNALDGNSDAALLVELGSHGTVARANTVMESEAGVVVSESHDVQVLDNVLNGASDDGITLETADRALVRGNDVRFNGGGIEVAGSSDGRVEGNDASEGGMGITLGDGSFRNTVVGNTATGNDSEGIAVNGEAPPGAGNLIDANTASDNAADGIFVGAVSHMIRGNTADGNGGWGIYAAEGGVSGVNIDGGGNRANGNVGGGLLDPVTQTYEQCYNVRCDGGAGLPTDQVAPETILLEAPADPSTFTTATFAFTGTDNASTVAFQCRLDSADPAAFAPCTSPVSYPGLALGEHTFTVRAVDFSGNPDASPVVHTWTIQEPDPLVPPVTTIASGPDANTVSTSATFTFSANEEGVTFECRLDGAAFAPCTSPVGYSALPVGSHVFEVRGTDPQGNVEVSPASFSWTVGPPPVAAAVSCGQVLTQSTRVTNDLLDCQGDGLVVGAAGITLDLDGHVIDGVGLGTGVLVNGFAAVTVTNGSVQEFDTGVGVTGASGALVSGVALQFHQVAGVGLTDADGAVVRGSTLAENSLGVLLTGGTQDARVTGNTLTGNPGPGIRLEGVTGNRVDANDVTESSEEGVVLDAAPGTVVVGNTLSGNSSGGIAVLAGSHDAVVADNTVTLSGSSGIEVVGSDRTDVVANVVTTSGGTGLALESANDGLVRGNDLRGNPSGLDLNASTGNLVERNDTGSSGGTGMAFEGGSIGNRVLDNRSSGNSGAGIYVGDQAAAGAGNLIEGNTADSNSGNGIDVNAAIHTVRGNSASGNDGWGIYVVTGNVDGGGNMASANAEPAQCWNVVCAIAPPPGAPTPRSWSGRTTRPTAATRSSPSPAPTT
ncbi:hypothetical protein BJF78_32245 [Pseudonocardia sp. CNS-139]|nr:hypothetical protein BJF78_32245 [Pseudonocardia sp. CNS-139]